MPESNEADIPIQQTEGASVVDLPDAAGDVIESTPVDTTEWSSVAAFLKDSGGLEEWRSFTATRTASIDATQVQLPKLTLLDDGGDSAKTLDSRAIAANAAVVDRTKSAAGAVPEFEGGQSVPGEPPRITDPLPSIPPGIHITIPNPHIPGFSVIDPALPGKPGISADPAIPIKAGAPGDAALPVMPGDPDLPKLELKRGQSVPTEPPKITDPLPRIPPPIQRIVDHGALTGRKSDTAGASLRHLNSGDITPAEKAVAAFKASLRAVEAQNQAVQNAKLAAELAAQIELKKLAALNPERAMKETAAAAALLARKALMRGEPGSEKNSAIKPGGRPKELGKRLQTPDGFAQKPALVHEKSDFAAVLNDGFTASILPERGKLGVASSLPVDNALLHSARGKELIAGIKLHEGTAASSKISAVEPSAARLAQLNDFTVAKPARAISQAFDFTAPTLSEKSKTFIAAHTPIERSLLRQNAAPELIAAHAPLQRSRQEGTAVEPVAFHTPIQRSLLQNGAALELAAVHTPVERSRLRQGGGADHVAAQTPVERSHSRHAAAAELVAAQTPVDRSHSRHAAEAELVAAQTPVERSHLRHAEGAELAVLQTPAERSLLKLAVRSESVAAHSPIHRSLLRQAAGAELVAANMHIARSIVGPAAGRDFVAATIPQNIKLTSRARHTIEPSITTARAGEATITNTFRTTARSLNFSPIPADRDRLLAAATSTDGKPLLRGASGEKGIVAGPELPVRLLKTQPHHLLHANDELPKGQEQFTVLHPIKRHTSYTYSRSLSENYSAPNSVEKLHGYHLEPSTEKAALKIARSLSNGPTRFTLPLTIGDGATSSVVKSQKDMIAIAHARGSIVSAQGEDLTAAANSSSPRVMGTEEPIPVADADDTIKTTSAKGSKQTELAQKVLSIADGDETATALTMFKSLLTSANKQKSNVDSFSQSMRIADAAPEREPIKKTGRPAQTDVDENQLTKTVSLSDDAEQVPANLAGELKLRVTYLHIGNRIFLLQRRLVEDNSHTKEPVMPHSELIATAGIAAVIAGRRLRRRKKKSDAHDTSSTSFNEYAEEVSAQTTDCAQHNRESMPLAQSVTRFSYMIQPDDTLVDLAQAIWQDSEVAWLLAEVNKFTHEWQGNECSITLVERQVIELPLPEEVVYFYKSGLRALHVNHKLTTIVRLSAFDEELTANPSLIPANQACRLAPFSGAPELQSLSHP